MLANRRRWGSRLMDSNERRSGDDGEGSGDVERESGGAAPDVVGEAWEGCRSNRDGVGEDEGRRPGISMPKVEINPPQLVWRDTKNFS